ncbi:MAG: hypothetical protein ACKOZU_03235 [Planctomycetaceae bacterium]
MATDMTSRERWTVYPLLFLALGLAIRAAVLTDERLAAPIETLEAGRVECRSLLVRDADGVILLEVPPPAAE